MGAGVGDEDAVGDRRRFFDMVNECRKERAVVEKNSLSSGYPPRWYKTRQSDSSSSAQTTMVQIKTDNPSFVLHGIENAKIEQVRSTRCTTNSQRPVPEIKGDQVLVEIAKTGICGSDVHYLQHARIGSCVLEEPMCLGHESSGVIAQLGPEVKPALGLKEGMRVALEPGVACGKCDECKSGSYEVGV